MKQLMFLLITVMLGLGAAAQQTKPDFSKQDPAKKVQKAEVSCGECKFKMKGQGCHLAVRVNGKAYWVNNADVDAFGDAHDKKMGFCNKIRKVEVQGEVKNNKYELAYLKFID